MLQFIVSPLISNKYFPGKQIHGNGFVSFFSIFLFGCRTAEIYAVSLIGCFPYSQISHYMKLTSMEISDVTRREAWKDRSTVKQTSVDAALVSGHPRDAKKMSVTGAGRLREWCS